MLFCCVLHKKRGAITWKEVEGAVRLPNTKETLGALIGFIGAGVMVLDAGEDDSKVTVEGTSSCILLHSVKQDVNCEGTTFLQRACYTL